MNPDTLLQVTRHDVALVRRTLHHLTAAQKITCVVVIAIAVLIWWTIAQRLLAFGRAIDYSGLHALGAQTVTLLQQYNPVFWWGVVVLGTLLLVYLLYGFVHSSLRRVRRKLLNQLTVERLTTQLSASALEVLNWVWQDRRHPMTVGNLQQVLAEMRSDRAGKIALARQHEGLISRALQQSTPTKPVAIDAEM